MGYVLLTLLAGGTVYALTTFLNRPVPAPLGIEQNLAKNDLPIEPAPNLVPRSGTVRNPSTNATPKTPTPIKSPPPLGMVSIPAGDFVMGTADGKVEEKPIHRVKVSAFFMDEHEVTNAEFRKFVEATNFVTLAEKPIDWEEMKKNLPPGTPKPPDSDLVPSSLVFTPPAEATDLNNWQQWWRLIPGADWKHPEGPKSNIQGKDNHPVVQVAFTDAEAYAKWAGKRLPTEAEWEYAARGGLVGKRYTWGDDKPGDDNGRVANIWQGKFPVQNLKTDGYDRTAPVKSYPANGYGLYDTAGNVWEWCSDWYQPRYPGEDQVNPKGPKVSIDEHGLQMPRRVTRGGSFLCHSSYCEAYRTGARQGSDVDTSMSHTGFRCVLSIEE